jgi:hypothetical protein
MRRVPRLVVASVLLAAPALAQITLLASAVWPVNAGGNGRTYAVYSTVPPMSWTAARTYAMGLGPGADLATPVTGGENAFIFNMIRVFPALWTSAGSGLGTYGPWIGGSLVSGSWTWISGEPFCFTNWAPGEPNSGCIAGPLENRMHYAIGANSTTGPTPVDSWNDLFDGACPAGGIIPTGFVVEYTSFDMVVTQTPTAITITNGVGAPFDLFFDALVVYAPGGGDPCLDGWWYGINPSFAGLVGLYSSGFPFVGALGPGGTSTFILPTAGIGFYQIDYVGVQISAANGQIVSVGKPKTIFTF